MNESNERSALTPAIRGNVTPEQIGHMLPLPATPVMRNSIAGRQHRERENGIIRLGAKRPNGAPYALTKFRLTSQHKELLEHAATVYGGTVQPWTETVKGTVRNKGWELFTESEELHVRVAPVPMDEAYELWSAGGIQRRCNGVCQTGKFEGKPCLCPHNPDGSIDHIKQAELAKAKPPMGCTAILRVSLVLYNLPDSGYWRFNTGSYYGMTEFPMSAWRLQRLAMQGIEVNAILKNPIRTKVDGGQTKKFTVPELHYSLTPEQLALMGASSGTPAPLSASAQEEEHFAEYQPDDDAPIDATATDFIDDDDPMPDEPAGTGQEVIVKPPVNAFLYDVCKFTEEQVLDLRAHCNDKMVDFDQVVLTCKDANRTSFDMLKLCAVNMRKKMDEKAAKAAAQDDEPAE